MNQPNNQKPKEGKKKTLLPTRIPNFDEAIYSFNSFYYKKDKTMMRYILREWRKKVKRIINRLEIMQEKISFN